MVDEEAVNMGDSPALLPLETHPGSTQRRRAVLLQRLAPQNPPEERTSLPEVACTPLCVDVGGPRLCIPATKLTLCNKNDRVQQDNRKNNQEQFSATLFFSAK